LSLFLYSLDSSLVIFLFRPTHFKTKLEIASIATAMLYDLRNRLFPILSCNLSVIFQFL